MSEFQKPYTKQGEENYNRIFRKEECLIEVCHTMISKIKGVYSLEKDVNGLVRFIDNPVDKSAVMTDTKDSL